jgi:hypothetical protein
VENYTGIHEVPSVVWKKYIRTFGIFSVDCKNITTLGTFISAL